MSQFNEARDWMRRAKSLNKGDDEIYFMDELKLEFVLKKKIEIWVFSLMNEINFLLPKSKIWDELPMKNFNSKGGAKGDEQKLYK